MTDPGRVDKLAARTGSVSGGAPCESEVRLGGSRGMSAMAKVVGSRKSGESVVGLAIFCACLSPAAAFTVCAAPVPELRFRVSEKTGVNGDASKNPERATQRHRCILCYKTANVFR